MGQPQAAPFPRPHSTDPISCHLRTHVPQVGVLAERRPYTCPWRQEVVKSLTQSSKGMSWHRASPRPLRSTGLGFTTTAESKIGRARTNMRSHIKVGRVFENEIRIHYSWFIITWLITFSLEASFHSVDLNWIPSAVRSTSVVTSHLY